MNVCSYHLQEAGATPEQELAFALATAIAVLDDLQTKVDAADFPQMVARISFDVSLPGAEACSKLIWINR